MILPYYKIDKTEEGKQFFFTHVGYFNFWDEYLIMNVGLGYKTYTCLVNRPNTRFKGEKQAESYKILRNLHVKASAKQRRPEEMFVDFPELKKFDYLKTQ